MLTEVQPGTYLDPNDVVAITEDYTFSYGSYGASKHYSSLVTLRNGRKFEVLGKRADEVAAILWPDDTAPRRLSE